jgi:hypothetical protein
LLGDLKSNGFDTLQKIGMPEMRCIEIPGLYDVAFECLCRALPWSVDEAEFGAIKPDLRQFTRGSGGRAEDFDGDTGACGIPR